MGNKNFIPDDYPELPNPSIHNSGKTTVGDEVSFNFIDKDASHLAYKRKKASQFKAVGMVVVWQETV